jgi:hypothetical protein
MVLKLVDEADKPMGVFPSLKGLGLSPGLGVFGFKILKSLTKERISQERLSPLSSLHFVHIRSFLMIAWKRIITWVFGWGRTNMNSH